MKNKHVNRSFNRVSLTLNDLCDTKFEFYLEAAISYFDYLMTAKVHDYYYHQSLNNEDIETLQMNCRKILEATEGLKCTK